MKKIMLIGSGGSGKSTLAKQLGSTLHIPVYHLDALFWKPKWTPVSRKEQIDIQRKLVATDGWIIDGNYAGTMDFRMAEADTIIFLDINRYLCTYRVFKRMLMYRNKTRPDMGANCPERFDLNFLKWIWGYPDKKKPAIILGLDNLPQDKTVITLTSSREVKAFLTRVNKTKNTR